MAQVTSAREVPWKTPLFDICGEPGGVGVCCYTLWCTSCAYGNNADMMQPGEAPCAGNCFGAAAAHFLLGSAVSQIIAAATTIYLPLNFSFLVHMKLRAGIRKKYNLAALPCHDCLVVFFCSPCAICQEYREICSQQNPVALQTVPVTPGAAWGQGPAQMPPLQR
mmetsp:Transcript_4019/g.12566  ORF Transcript_4019/g.12566 Transcript_4019/m.12566 type:complete len:165 (+) Transcript_4019:190-684(+)